MSSVTDLISGMKANPDRTAPDDYDEPVYVPPPVTTVEGERPTCTEPGCEKPCRKRKNRDDFFPYCAMHNALHAGNQSSTPRSGDPMALQEARNRSAEKLAERVFGWGVMLQAGLIANDDRYCAAVLRQEWPLIAKASGELALDFDWLANGIEKVDKYGTLAMLIFHITKMGAAMAAHHGWVQYDGVIRFLIPPMNPDTTATMKSNVPPQAEPSYVPPEPAPAYATPPEPSFI